MKTAPSPSLGTSMHRRESEGGPQSLSSLYIVQEKKPRSWEVTIMDTGMVHGTLKPVRDIL